MFVAPAIGLPLRDHWLPVALEDVSVTLPPAQNVVALRAEHAYAEEKLQTRPLWQLLVCFSALLNRSDTVASDKELLRKALADSLRFLEKNTQLDPGGQCKHRIRQLLKR